MRAFVIETFAGIDALREIEQAEPVAGPGQVLVKLEAASLNYRDLMIVDGRLPIDRPMIPLCDGAGQVVAVGAGVTGLAVGDRVINTYYRDWEDGEISEAKIAFSRGVTLPGVLAEYVVFEQREVVRIPAGLGAEQAATLACAGVTVWHALVDLGQIQPGDTVLTLGTGSVSLFAIQLARMHGARVLVTSSSDERLARARALGADETINYLRHPAWHEEVLRRTDGRGVDHVIEVGGAGTFERSIAATRLGGHVAMIGLLDAEGGGRAAALQILARAVRVTGVRVASRQALLALARAIERHPLQPVIDRVFPFDAARDAYRHLARGGHFGKVVIRY